MDIEKRIVRFAPSPTGHLHIGGARTALFNYLFVKKSEGKFILRIEDTDKERSTSEMSEEIIESLGWLGLEPDSPPYFQSEHTADYLKIAKNLLEEKKAYRCFCTPAEIESRRIQNGEIKFFKYDRFCQNLSEEEIKIKIDLNIPFVIRFFVPNGETGFKDRIHKEIKSNNDEIEDFVLVRSDGTPTYHLSVVSDDIKMEISDVIRGDDHISNTFKQILLFLAIGKKPPRYSHLPLIVGNDKKKLSKRHGETSIAEFKRKGYLPEAIITYLSHLSWSPNDHKKIYNLKELISDFKFSAISKNSPVFDYDKLIFLNSRAIRQADPVKILKILFEDEKVKNNYSGIEHEKLYSLIELVKPRMKLIPDFVSQFKVYLSDLTEYDMEEFNKLEINGRLDTTLNNFLDELRDVEDFSGKIVEYRLREFAKKEGVTAAYLIHPLRFAIINSTVSPSLFDIMEFLGKESTINRINGFILFLKKNVISD